MNEQEKIKYINEWPNWMRAKGEERETTRELSEAIPQPIKCIGCTYWRSSRGCIFPGVCQKEDFHWEPDEEPEEDLDHDEDGTPYGAIDDLFC